MYTYEAAQTTAPPLNLSSNMRFEEMSPTSWPAQTIASDAWQYLLGQGKVIKLAAEKDLWLGALGPEFTYVVLKGMMRLYRLTEGGKAITVMAATTGGMLGHHPYLKQREGGLIAESMTDTVLLVVPVRQFSWLSKAKGCIYRDFIHEWLITDLNHFQNCMYQRLQVQEAGAREKLARILLAVNAAGLQTKLNRRQLAELANLTPETTVRLITLLNAEGVLKNKEVNALDSEEQRALQRIVPEGKASLPYL